MHWLLYSKTSTGSWSPVFGVLSEVAGGALVYAAVTAAPAYVIWRTAKNLRDGAIDRARCKWVIAWAAAAWPLFILWGIPHAYTRGSPEYILARLVATGLSVPYLILGLWKVLPFMVRARKSGRSDLSAREPRA